jgi:hypothetical protein
LGHFFFPIVKTLLWVAPVNAGPDGILGSTRNLPTGDYARSFGKEPYRKRCWNANQTGWPELHLCTQNARGTVVATEATTFLRWNVFGIGRLLHLLFCVLCLFSRSLSLSLSHSVRMCGAWEICRVLGVHPFDGALRISFGSLC